LKRGRPEDVAAVIAKGQPLQIRLLAAPRPTLGAMEAVSDLDDVYARMLLSGHHDGWARMLYQKNFGVVQLSGPRSSVLLRLRRSVSMFQRWPYSPNTCSWSADREVTKHSRNGAEPSLGCTWRAIKRAAA
jgi:hypothetical protein